MENVKDVLGKSHAALGRYLDILLISQFPKTDDISN